jgi:hypothetical protein
VKEGVVDSKEAEGSPSRVVLAPVVELLTDLLFPFSRRRAKAVALERWWLWKNKTLDVLVFQIWEREEKRKRKKLSKRGVSLEEGESHQIYKTIHEGLNPSLDSRTRSSA